VPAALLQAEGLELVPVLAQVWALVLLLVLVPVLA
jgi:hypothetical protein